MPVLSWDEVAAVARAGGFPAGPAVYAVAITMPESSRDDTAVQAGQPYALTGWGLWQITPGNSEPQYGIDNQLLDPLNNARAAVAKWSAAGGFAPWTTYENGLELPYIADAEQAVATIYSLLPGIVAQLVSRIRDGGGTPAPGQPQVQNWAVHVRRAAAVTAKSALAHQDHARAVAALRGRFTPPAVRPAAPGQVLIPPGRL